ncbi:MgtC/SapB family protein [Pseudomonas mosselii]|uniref:MgtC/SapB family protein n=1 Tax=Pseudomonas mosselii TaxID=78327 RepID=UPI002448EAAC|nr:MgtC/SapB family protein [Pseudomonas mosselii]MDH1103939.1 MgtC/SapB family protein [Pseudomonas mosselii]
MDAFWHSILEALHGEFADVTDEREVARILIRLLVAALLGAVLGFERESKGKAAGVRTHMLVSMGAALFVLAPSMAGADEQALSRVIQGIVAGIGFLGAGTILKGNGQDASHVKGLTTAAGLWMTAAIGTAAGMGREATALVSTVMALLVLASMPLLVDKVEGEVREKKGGENEEGRKH